MSLLQAKVRRRPLKNAVYKCFIKQVMLPRFAKSSKMSGKLEWRPIWSAECENIFHIMFNLCKNIVLKLSQM